MCIISQGQQTFVGIILKYRNITKSNKDLHATHDLQPNADISIPMNVSLLKILMTN